MYTLELSPEQVTVPSKCSQVQNIDKKMRKLINYGKGFLFLMEEKFSDYWTSDNLYKVRKDRQTQTYTLSLSHSLSKITKKSTLPKLYQQ